MPICLAVLRLITSYPDSITEQILHQREVTGAGVVAVRLELGDVDLDKITDNMELFAREVLPVLKKS